MQQRKMSSNYFTARIGEFNFEKFYTSRKRLMFHILMWLSFALLLFLSYRLAYHLTYFNSFILTMRMCVVNMIVFYMFFYLFLPKILKQPLSSAVYGLVFSFPVFVIIWLLSTFSFSLIYHSLGYEILNGELKGVIAASANQTFWQAISLNRMVSQAIIIISILSPFFFVKILFEISKLYSRTINIQKQKSLLEIQNINIEKDFLKSQLNPHFLFNTLNNLYSLSLKKDDAVPEVILNLSDTMSYTLYESNTEIVELWKEMEFVKNYVELEKMRYSSDKNIHYEFPSEKDCQGLRIAPLLTFTFIENAFKYGLKSKCAGFLKLKIKVENDNFIFELENDLEISMKKNTHGGIGLENVRKRLQLLYPDNHQLEILNSESVFRVKLIIDLN
ncbi:sensor histidine kinase [Chryseobacterium mulctrae]|uniref:sensor histidine kinase n=1 Tax=Chryseobacterium mulctrae TaxID=2576777 RepID=UPI001E5702F9|nr:histidine kinase [Chryseobacterium mulctrae]